MTLPSDQELQRDDPSLANVGLMETLVEHWILCDDRMIDETDDEFRKYGMDTISPCESVWRCFLGWINRDEGPELEARDVTIDTFHWLMRRRFMVVSGYGALNYVGLRLGAPA